MGRCPSLKYFGLTEAACTQAIANIPNKGRVIMGINATPAIATGGSIAFNQIDSLMSILEL